MPSKRPTFKLEIIALHNNQVVAQWEEGLYQPLALIVHRICRNWRNHGVVTAAYGEHLAGKRLAKVTSYWYCRNSVTSWTLGKLSLNIYEVRMTKIEEVAV